MRLRARRRFQRVAMGRLVGRGNVRLGTSGRVQTVSVSKAGRASLGGRRGHVLALRVVKIRGAAVLLVQAADAELE